MKLWVFLFFCLVSNWVFGAEMLADTKITSDGKLVIDYKKQIADFCDNVLVQEKDSTLRSDKLTVYFSHDSESIEKMVAVGHVVIDQKEQKAESEKAEYFAKQEKLVLTGKPIIQKGPNCYSADVITIFTATNKVVFEPSAKIVIKKDKSKTKKP